MGPTIFRAPPSCVSFWEAGNSFRTCSAAAPQPNTNTSAVALFGEPNGRKYCSIIGHVYIYIETHMYIGILLG